jgi:hypothetical protein
VPGLTGAGLSGNPNLDMNSLLGMFGGLGTIMGNTPEVNTVPPEQLYASQLSRLQEMGFVDTQENVRALIAVGGNVNAAVNRLLGNLDYNHHNGRISVQPLRWYGLNNLEYTGRWWWRDCSTNYCVLIFLLGSTVLGRELGNKWCQFSCRI